MLTSEFEINDAPLSARNGLTKGHVQDEIRQFSGCAVTTRGRYMTAAERLKNPSERALYLFIQGPSKQNLDLAIQKIDEIIRMEQNSGGMKNRGNPSYTPTTITSVEKVYVGIENVLPSFDLRGKLIGVRGANLNYIRSETGAIVTLRGKGSLFIDPNLGAESSEPLHLYIEHPKYEGLNAAKQLALNLIETLQQEVAQLQPQVIIQPQTPQQVNIYPNQHNENMINFKPNAPPPQLNIPPPGVHIPTQQGPMVSHPPPTNNSQLPIIQTIEGQSNFSGTTNQMILTNNSGLMPAAPNGGQQIYCTPANQNLIHNIQTSTQQMFQQSISMPIQVTNRNANIETTTINMGQYQTQVAPSQQLHQEVTPGTQYSSQNSQIVGFNNLTHFVPAAQIPQQGQLPQMQIVQSANQPLHILSSQGLTVQNHPQFIQQQIQMNSLQTPSGTINALQVPGNASGPMTFQIPIQTQNTTSFIPQSNLQGQTPVLLTQQNLQSPQNLQQSTQFQLQPQQFSNQVPLMQNIQTGQAPTFMNQGQHVGVYTTQGLVLVQNNQNLTSMQTMSNFNPSLVTTSSSNCEISQNSNHEISTSNIQIHTAASQDQKIESVDENKLSNENATINSQPVLQLDQNQESGIVPQNFHQFNQLQVQPNQQMANYQVAPQNYQQPPNVSINTVPMSLQQIQNINENNSNLMANQAMTFPIQPPQTVSVSLPHQFNQEIHSTQGFVNQDHHGNQTKKRRFSETGQVDENNQEDASGMKKSGVGVDQAQHGKVPANTLPRGNFTQHAQSSCGPSAGDSQTVDGCRSFENQNQITRMVREENSGTMQDPRGLGGNVSTYYNYNNVEGGEAFNYDDAAPKGPINNNANGNDNWQQWNSNNGTFEMGNVDSNFQVRAAVSPGRASGGQMRPNLPYKYNSQFSSRASFVRTPYPESYRRERGSYQQQNVYQYTQRPQQGGWFPQSGNGNNSGSWM